MKNLQDAQIKDKKVIVRVDFDVVKDGKIKDDDRLQKALPTIEFLLEEEAKQIILISHNGKPKEQEKDLSLEPVQKWLYEHLKQDILFMYDCTQEKLPEDRIILLENLRFHKEEKENNQDFAKQLASYADIYVNNAFATSHRDHASITGIPQYIPGYAGLILQKEIEMLSQITDEPQRPFIVIAGFAKISDKIELLEQLLKQADKLLLGGAVIFTFLKAQGKEIGKSLVEDDKLKLANQLLEKYEEKIILPTDIVIADSLEGQNPETVSVDNIPKDKIGLDIGEESIKAFKHEIQHAKLVFWNGPVGMFELPPFDQATNQLATFIGELPLISIIGGGDTTKAIKHAKVYDQMTHVSTGGGASLAFVEGKPLPGIEALK